MGRDGLKPESFWKQHRIFISLLAIGLIFRFLFMYYQGLSNDELSAWNRTRFDDWTSFWQSGVKAGDMHPVFYQAFLWVWVRIFGDSELALRSTSILFYLLNSWLVYKISIRFFSKQVGLALIALYAGLAFTIIHTVFARPYNSGVFFLLLLVWSIFELNQSKRRISVWHLTIILGFLGAMLSHYYAFLTAGIIGLLSLFYVENRKIKDIVIVGCISILLFLPHWPVTQFQLSQGGLGWLSPPKWNWLVDFFYQFFNYSWLVFAFFVVSVLFSLSQGTHFKNAEEKFVLRIFLLTYIAGHLISLFYTPVLRELVMLYTLPFLMLYLFRGFQFSTSAPFNTGLIVVPIIIGIHSLMFVHLLEPKNFGVFREIGQAVNEAEQKKGQENMEFASNFCDVAYINYYYQHDVAEPIKDWAKPEVVYALAERAKTSDKEYFVYNWSNNAHMPMYYEVIRKYYPNIWYHKDYFNSAATIFSKGENLSGKPQQEKLKLKYENSFPSDVISKDEFIGAIKIPALKLAESLDENAYVLVEMEGTLAVGSPCHFVATLERDGQMLMDKEVPVFYVAYDQSLLVEKQQKERFFCAFSLPKDLTEADVVHIYLWNPEKQEIFIQKPTVSTVNLSGK